jgi:hypothetical protein
MTEWHTYTILFEDGEERYLVDGQHVATSPSVPESAMGVEIQVGNECWDPNKIAQREGEHSPLGGDYVVAGIDSEESIQVDYVKVFWSAETFNSMSEEVSELFLQAEEAVSELDETGLGDTSPIASAIQGAADSWERYHCDVRPVLQNIVSLPGLCQNLPFPYAEQLISGLDESNPFVARFEQTLTEAEAAWNNALASLRNPSTFDSYYDMAIERLTEIRTQIEAHNEILGGNLVEVAEGDLAGIADNRTRMMLAVKLDLAKGVWESGDYSAAKVYLDQIGEPGLALALLLSLLYPVLRRV